MQPLQNGAGLSELHARTRALRAFLWSALGLGAGCGAAQSSVPEAARSEARAALDDRIVATDLGAGRARTVVGLLARRNGVEVVELRAIDATVPDACVHATGVGSSVQCPPAEDGRCITSIDCQGGYVCVTEAIGEPGACVKSLGCACGPPTDADREEAARRAEPKATTDTILVDSPRPFLGIETVCTLHDTHVLHEVAAPQETIGGAPPALRSEDGVALGCLPVDREAFEEVRGASLNPCASYPVRVRGEVRAGRWHVTTTPPPRRDRPCGRPLVIEGAARVAVESDASGWRTPPAGSTLGREVALDAHWSGRLQAIGFAEHASIAAFARTIVQLCALGAPAWLIDETARALADEVRHANGAFALAQAFAGTLALSGPGKLPEAVAPLASGDLSETLLLDVIRGGCVGESLAVLEASAYLAEAPPLAHPYFATVVEEEAMHAALAFRTVRWILGQRPDLVGVAERAFDEAIADADAPRDAEQMLRDLVDAIVTRDVSNA